MDEAQTARIERVLERLEKQAAQVVEADRRKAVALQSLARELHAAAGVLVEAGLPENAKLLTKMAERAFSAATVTPEPYGLTMIPGGKL